MLLDARQAWSVAMRMNAHCRGSPTNRRFCVTDSTRDAKLVGFGLYNQLWNAAGTSALLERSDMPTGQKARLILGLRNLSLQLIDTILSFNEITRQDLEKIMPELFAADGDNDVTPSA